MSEQRTVDQPAQNTDRELWRERPGDYYADSIFVTADGQIGISGGGTIYVASLRDWCNLASGKPFSGATEQPTLETSRNWWCPLCEKEVPPERVTHDEVHDACYGGCDGKVYSTRQDAEIIRAQHDETGRVWAGPRACLPKGYSEVRSSKTVAVLTAAKITELTTKYPALGVDRFVHERDYEQLQREMEHRERYWAQFDHVPKGTAFETNTQPSSNSLLQRLREFETYHDNRKPLSPTGLCREAADEIERLQRENAELKATDGYVGAFYKIGELLGLTAMPISPKEAFETVMFPRLRQLVDGAAVETNDGYKDAFYEIAKILDMAAMPISPKEAFETVMVPKLRALVSRETPAVMSECPYCKRPADRQGGILHEAGCAGLETVEINRLQFDALLSRTAQKSTAPLTYYCVPCMREVPSEHKQNCPAENGK